MLTVSATFEAARFLVLEAVFGAIDGVEVCSSIKDDGGVEQDVHR